MLLVGAAACRGARAREPNRQALLGAGNHGRRTDPCRRRDIRRHVHRLDRCRVRHRLRRDGLDEKRPAGNVAAAGLRQFPCGPSGCRGRHSPSARPSLCRSGDGYRLCSADGGSVDHVNASCRRLDPGSRHVLRTGGADHAGDTKAYKSGACDAGDSGTAGAPRRRETRGAGIANGARFRAGQRHAAAAQPGGPRVVRIQPPLGGVAGCGDGARRTCAAQRPCAVGETLAAAVSLARSVPISARGSRGLADGRDRDHRKLEGPRSGAASAVRAAHRRFRAFRMEPAHRPHRLA